MLAGVMGAAATPGGGGGRGGRRTAWLASVRATLAEAGPLIEEARAFGIEAAGMHARVAAALAATEALGGGEAIDAGGIARELAAAAGRALAAQATIDAEAARAIAGHAPVNRL